MILALCVLFTANGASAGSRGNPELVDPAGDTVDYFTNQPVTSGGQDLDVVAMWFGETETEFSVTVKVADMIPTSQWRAGVTSHAFIIRWDVGNVTLDSRLGRDSFGSTFVGLARVGGGAAITSFQSPPRVAIEFDAERDEVRATYPRSFALDQITGRENYDFVKGTRFLSVRVEGYEGPGGTASGCAPCVLLDSTSPGSPFEFGSPSTANAHTRVRPDEAVLASRPLAATGIALTATGHPFADMETVLTASLDRPGWSVEPSTATVIIPANRTVPIVFNVTAPTGATEGETARLLLAGGDVDVGVILVVGEEAARQVRDSLTSQAAGAGAMVDRTYFLYGSTQSPTAGADPRPVFEAELVTSAPSGNAPAVVRLDFSPTDTRLPAGSWRSSPFVATGRFSGNATLEVYANWTDLSGLALFALVGSHPLPIDWTGTAAPPGTFAVLPVGPASPASGSGPLTASGTIDGLVLRSGDRLAVSLFFEKSGGSGELTANVFARFSPSRLNVSTEQSGLFEIAKAAFPAARMATLATGTLAGAALSGSTDIQAVVSAENGIGFPLTPAIAPGKLTFGNQGRTPVTTTQAGEFARTDEFGTRRTHAFDMNETAVEAVFRLGGPHSANRFQDNNLDLEVFKVSGNDRSLVKAARSFDPVEELKLTAFELEENGRGTYEAVVVLEQDLTRGVGVNLPYSLTLSQSFYAEYPDSVVEARFPWDYSSTSPGTYIVKIDSRDPSGIVSETQVEYALTSLGPTLPPLASFTFSPSLPSAGDTVRFLDASNDTDGLVKNWSWDFGDGSTSDEQSPTHAYGAAGAYVVRLTATDDFGAASLAVTSTVTVVEAGTVGGGAGPIPSTGSVAVYKDAYLKRLAHRENYTSAWRSSEVAGLSDREYLAPSLLGRTAYVYGNSLSLPTLARWAGTTLSVSNLLGVLTAFDRGDVVQTMGDARVVAQVPKVVKVSGRDVDISGLASVPIDRDTLDDGLLTVTTAAARDNVNARRTLSILDGLLHSDVRTLVGAAASDAIQLETTTTLTLPGASWVAIGNAGDPEVVPLNPNSTREFTVAGTNAWLAIFNPDASTVAGAVFSGDAKKVNWTFSSSRLTVRTLYEATGELLAGQYLLVYTTAEDDATRYAGVMELARMDAEEIGVAALDPMRAAGLGWAGSRATISGAVAQALGADWDALNGYPNTWTLDVDASSSQGGKPLRLILPAAAASSGGLAFLLDGAEIPLSGVSALGDENTLIATFAIDHFSARTVSIRSIVPGLPPIFLWATLALGAVVSTESLALARQALAGGGGAGAAPRLGSGAQSAAVRRALGYTEGETGPASSLETREIKGIIAGDRVRLTSDRLPSSVQTEAVRRALGLDKETMESKERLLERLRAGASLAPHSPPAATKCKNCGGAITFSAGSVTATCATCGAANTRGEHG